MEETTFCQSCSMPLDNVRMRGTEKDGSINNEYCKYCYSNGAFCSPNMTPDEMKVIIRTQLEKMHSPESIIQKALTVLPHLKRWNNRVKAQ